MADTNASFKIIVSAIDALLKPRGWKRTGQQWRRDLDEVVMFVHLQRGKMFMRGQLTANLGVTSRRVFAHEPSRQEDMHALSSHWKCRLTSDGAYGDAWWPLDQPEAVAAELAMALVAHWLPRLERFSTDIALRDAWAAGEGPGVTDAQRSVFMGILARELGPSALVERARRELEGYRDIRFVRDFFGWLDARDGIAHR